MEEKDNDDGLSFIATVLGTMGVMYLLAFVFLWVFYAAGWIWGRLEPRINTASYKIALWLESKFPSHQVTK